MHQSRFLFLTLALPLAVACSATTARNNVPDILALAVSEPPTDQVTRSFRDVCMAGAGLREKTLSRAEADGWIEASEKGLEEAGLERLRKQVLEVPGGGARVSETQSIFQKTIDGKKLTLAVEEKFVAGRHATTSCTSFVSDEDLLPICASVGKQIGKSPDTNRRYERAGAQFITWKVRMGEKPASVICQRAPQAAILPYDGVSLVLRVDHSGMNAIKPGKSRSTNRLAELNK